MTVVKLLTCLEPSLNEFVETKCFSVGNICTSCPNALPSHKTTQIMSRGLRWGGRGGITADTKILGRLTANSEKPL